MKRMSIEDKLGLDIYHTDEHNSPKEFFLYSPTAHMEFQTHSKVFSVPLHTVWQN